MRNAFTNCTKRQVFRNHDIPPLWRPKGEGIFCMIYLLSLHNFGTVLYPTSKKHLFLSTTLQWMSSCCHVRYVANSSSTWLINQTRFFEVLAGSWCRKQIFTQGISLRRKRWYAELIRERSYGCCYESEGPEFPARLQCHVWFFFILFDLALRFAEKKCCVVSLEQCDKTGSSGRAPKSKAVSVSVW